MTSKEYLKQIENLESQLESLSFELEAAKRSIIRIRAIRYDKIKVQNGTKPHEAEFESHIDRIIDLRRRVAEKITQTELKRLEIINALNAIPNTTHSRLLFKVYVEHKTLAQCAEELALSYDYTVELHKKALKGVRVP